MNRRSYRSGTEWEQRVGYSRAVRVGAQVHVSGTTATDADGRIVGVGDVAEQMRQCLRNIATALEQLGARLEHVVRTRIYVIDIEHWERIGSVHEEVFATIRPATSMVQVAGLIAPEILVEVEAEAYVESE